MRGKELKFQTDYILIFFLANFNLVLSYVSKQNKVKTISLLHA